MLDKLLRSDEHLPPRCRRRGCSNPAKGDYGGYCEDCWADNLRGVTNSARAHAEATRRLRRNQEP